MKIAIVTPGGLPVPPINGGAVENLVYTMILENEISDTDLMIDVYSIEEDGISNYINEQKTNYFFIKKEIINKSILINKVIRKIRIIFNHSYYLNRVLDLMEDNNYKYILVENRPSYVMEIERKINSNIILHMHNEHLTSYKNYQKVVDVCNKIFVVSDYIKNTIMDRYNTDKDKIKVLHNGIDVERFKLKSQEDMEYRERFNLSKDDFVILFSGRLVKEKGISEVINAFNMFSNMKNFKLLIVGASWFSNNTDNMFIKNLKSLASVSSENIIFTGYVNYKEIHKVYKIADVAILPSTWNDPFPLTVLECMSVGLPIISTISGGIPEMVGEDSGILVPIDNDIIMNLYKSIKYLYENNDIRIKMGEYAHRKVQENFSNHIFFQQFIKYLNE